MFEHGYHVLVGLMVKVMGPVAPVQDVGHIIWWRGIDNS